MLSLTSLWKKVLLLVAIVGLVSTLLAGGAVYAQQGNPPSDVIDADKLPVCAIRGPIDPATLPPPDLNAQTACRLPTKALEVGPEAPGPGRLPGSQTTNNYAWALHDFSCQWAANCSTSSPGFTEMYFNVSTQIPTLPAGKSWSDYHFYNRVHFFHPSYSSSGICGWAETFSTGIAYGNVQGTNWTNRIIAENQTSTSCSLTDSGVNVSGPGAITFHIFRSGSNWAIDVWLGQWSRVATYSKSWAVAAGAEYGQELWARNADLGTIVAPVNFAHKALVSGTSNSLRNWSDYALVSPLSGKTQSLPAGANVVPLRVMDLFPGDFTSMASYYIH